MSSAGSCYMLALEPPGNVARDLVAYRRTLFSLTGDATSLFLPEVLPLAFARRLPGVPLSAAAVGKALEGAWQGVKGGFAASAIVASRGSLYLGLEGPVGQLADRSREAFSLMSLEPADDPVLEPGKGFFLRGMPLEAERAELPRPPAIAFRDCFLTLLVLRFGPSPRASASWRELARARRRTGPVSARTR